MEGKSICYVEALVCMVVTIAIVEPASLSFSRKDCCNGAMAAPSINSTTTVTGSGATSTFCAEKPDGAYANPQSCSSFWACWDHGLHGSLLLCPPNTLWDQHRLSCTSPYPFNASVAANSTSLNSSSSCISSLRLTNTSAMRLRPPIPVWSSWDGLLHCYGYGCVHRITPNGNDSRHINQLFNIGIPCGAGRELIAIAERSRQAWMPAPHALMGGVGGSNHRAGQHWKIRFDELRKATDQVGEGSLTHDLLKASITDYSPGERVVEGWQGGAMREALQFVMQGPMREVGADVQQAAGRCYYSVAMESSELKKMVWEAFARDLVKLQMKRVTTKKRPSRGSVGGTQGSMQQLQSGDVVFHKLRRRRRSGIGHHRNDDMLVTVQGCLRSIPWAGLVATALCYASNVAGGLQSMNRCASDLPFPELFTLAKCFASLLGIGPQLGL